MSLISDLLKSVMSGSSSSSSSSKKSTKKLKKSSGDIIDTIGDQVKIRATAYKAKRLKGNVLDSLISADVVGNVVDMAEDRLRASMKGSKKK